MLGDNDKMYDLPLITTLQRRLEQKQQRIRQRTAHRVVVAIATADVVPKVIADVRALWEHDTTAELCSRLNPFASSSRSHLHVAPTPKLNRAIPDPMQDPPRDTASKSGPANLVPVEHVNRR